MRRWVIGAGLLFLALGLVPLTPIADFLPVGIFATNVPGYYRIVPVSGTNLPFVVLFATGLLLVVSGKLWGTKRKQ
jgi:hypothetical protein